MLLLKAKSNYSKEILEGQEKELSEKIGTKVVIIPSWLEIVAEGK